jgi:hypothetical protein
MVGIFISSIANKPSLDCVLYLKVPYGGTSSSTGFSSGHPLESKINQGGKGPAKV